VIGEAQEALATGDAASAGALLDVLGVADTDDPGTGPTD
jgi:hypothetical protein